MTHGRWSLPLTQRPTPTDMRRAGEICSARLSPRSRTPISRPIARTPAPREPTLLFTPQPAARRHPNFLHPTISSSAQVPLAGSAALLAVGIWATAEPTTVVAAQGAKAPLKRRPSWEAKFAGGWGDTTPEIEAQLTAAMDKIGTPESGANSP